RFSAKVLYHYAHNLIVHIVQTKLIYIKRVQRKLGNTNLNFSVSFYLGEVANPSEQCICNSGCPAAAPCYFQSCIFINLDSKYARTPFNNHSQQFNSIIFQACLYSKPGEHWLGKHTAAGSCSYQGKGIKTNLYTSRIRAGLQ